LYLADGSLYDDTGPCAGANMTSSAKRRTGWAEKLDSLGAGYWMLDALMGYEKFEKLRNGETGNLSDWETKTKRATRAPQKYRPGVTSPNYLKSSAES
jgi:hypothetical protein